MAALTITQEELKAIMREAMQAALTHVSSQATTTFSVVPGGGDQTKTWDLTSDKGMKYFAQATKAPDTLFDGTIEKLHNFLGLIKKRATTYGMMSVIANINIGNNKTRSILTEYGSITEAQIKAHAEVYQKEDNRQRQAAKMVEALIANSIEQDVFDELEQREDKYTVKVTPTGGNAEVTRQDGPMMLYQLISMVCVDTKATVATILDHLSRSGLVQAMADADSDIKAFNRKVNTLIISLRARQEAIPSLIAPLFKAYVSCEDKAFSQYFRRKEEQYEDGSLTEPKEHAALIRLAGERYKIITGKKEWKMKSEEELKFIALKATVDQQNKQLTQKPMQKAKPTQQKEKQGPNNVGEWAWKSVPPKEGEPIEKKFRSKEYIYCPHQGETKWVLKVNRQGVVHSTNCRARQKSDTATSLTATTDTDSESQSSDANTPSKRDIRIAQALTSVLEEELSGITEDENLMTPGRS
ncbi:hypothetical protein SEMRO_1689_G291300.1 [Seminavis robusta]|uniref:Uncharacterized protein n=1 Tax=Seminavis robusta TaxID=568900 RepID=A0A9N8ESB1_9STRA|nr:hypothetical protein SEMRO_1689_G291300.1 [Seminavis robusta]|eukprot:Sro1689_g291300.1 n/a (469) ;mRNA; r:17549-18955